MKKEGKIGYTEYWIFFNHPNNWYLDKFLENNINNISVTLALTLPNTKKINLNKKYF